MDLTRKRFNKNHYEVVTTCPRETSHAHKVHLAGSGVLQLGQQRVFRRANKSPQKKQDNVHNPKKKTQDWCERAKSSKIALPVRPRPAGQVSRMYCM